MTISNHTTTGGTVRLATLLVLAELTAALLGIAKDLIPVFLPAAPAAPTQAQLYDGTGTLGCMGDVDGLEEFGGLARWRDIEER